MLRSGQRVGIELFCQITNKIIYQKMWLFSGTSCKDILLLDKQRIFRQIVQFIPLQFKIPN